MALGYHINSEEGLVTINGSENVRFDEAKQVGEALLNDPHFDAQLPQLVDLRGLIYEPDSIQDPKSFRHFAVDIYRQRVSSSIAIVVNESLDSLALAGLYHMSCSMTKTELFDQYDQALKWLMRKEFALAQ